MSDTMWLQILDATWETIYMVLVSTFLATLFGAPLGVVLLTTRKHGITEHRRLNQLLSLIVNALRSIPFIILLVAIIPFTRLLVGTSIGTTAAIVPLTVGAIPFVAKMIENILTEVPHGLIEAGIAMGASPYQIIRKILLPEAASGIINAITVTLVTLVGYSAMAGAIGGGGLGDLAIRYGYQRFDVQVMFITVIILIAIVQVLQFVGDRLARLFDKSKL